MPKTVDHEVRRAQLADAVVRVAARDGLHAVTMRSVAAEADVSLRQVQYYFRSKAELLHGTLRHLEQQSRERWSARLAELPRPYSGRAVVEAFLAEALPSDEVSRAFHLLGASYAVLAMTDPDLAEQPFVAGLNHLESQLADALRAAQAEGDLPVELDVSREAARLIAINHGIGTSVLVGQRTAEEAEAVLRYHVDRLFGSSG
ncbi:TetR/AcrR family transcriptional regulator [Thermocrispum municipale]|uniref:TetR/AcrR family transcriptional regulator n=1 Tax=Thermocrispum municipale TaxID=37926 RepID=UPI000404EE38|nr:TetR/AcrR family transcriptional regulator [Thermocrispum municipale]